MSVWYFAQSDACAHDLAEAERKEKLEQEKERQGHQIVYPAIDPKRSTQDSKGSMYRLSALFAAASRADIVYFMDGWRHSWACRELWDACQKFGVFVMDEIEVVKNQKK